MFAQLSGKHKQRFKAFKSPSALVHGSAEQLLIEMDNSVQVYKNFICYENRFAYLIVIHSVHRWYGVHTKLLKIKMSKAIFLFMNYEFYLIVCI